MDISFSYLNYSILINYITVQKILCIQQVNAAIVLKKWQLIKKNHTFHVFFLFNSNISTLIRFCVKKWINAHTTVNISSDSSLLLQHICFIFWSRIQFRRYTGAKYFRFQPRIIPAVWMQWICTWRSISMEILYVPRKLERYCERWTAMNVCMLGESEICIQEKEGEWERYIYDPWNIENLWMQPANLVTSNISFSIFTHVLHLRADTRSPHLDTLIQLAYLERENTHASGKLKIYRLCRIVLIIYLCDVLEGAGQV